MKAKFSRRWLRLSVLASASVANCDYDRESEYEAEASASSLSNTVPPVASPAEVEKMQRHIDSMYERANVVHTFKAVSGDIVDCVPLWAQPAMRAPDMEGMSS